MSQCGPSDLLHRECGQRLERVMIYARGPEGEPGLFCWKCQRAVPLVVLAHQLRLRGRWGR
jgi:hypothetical protein